MSYTIFTDSNKNALYNSWTKKFAFQKSDGWLSTFDAGCQRKSNISA